MLLFATARRANCVDCWVGAVYVGHSVATFSIAVWSLAVGSSWGGSQSRASNWYVLLQCGHHRCGGWGGLGMKFDRCHIGNCKRVGPVSGSICPPIHGSSNVPRIPNHVQTPPPPQKPMRRNMQSQGLMVMEVNGGVMMDNLPAASVPFWIMPSAFWQLAHNSHLLILHTVWTVVAIVFASRQRSAPMDVWSYADIWIELVTATKLFRLFMLFRSVLGWTHVTSNWSNLESIWKLTLTYLSSKSGCPWLSGAPQWFHSGSLTFIVCQISCLQGSLN